MYKTNKSMIAVIREERNVSQKELANKLNINRALLSQIETGKVLPNFAMLILIARELNCLVIDLYRKEELEIINGN